MTAEIGNNHEGNYALAEEMIGKAAEAGADAVKFQTFISENYVSKTDRKRYEKLKAFEMSEHEFEKLAAVAKNENILFLSTPFDLKSAEFLDSIVPAFKIASGDNNFYPLIETIARFAKPVILSSGLAGTTEIGFTKMLIEKTWKEIKCGYPGIAVLHCVTSYPVPPSEANLKAISTLKELFGLCVGYSDHTLGIEAAVLSVALGARIIEKHFTIDKRYSDFRDHQLSVDPGDLRKLVDRIRECETLLGNGRKGVQNCEKKLEPLVRRSIAAARDLSAGEVLQMKDITWIRPAGGIPPGHENLVLGKCLKKNIAAGQIVTTDILK